MILWDGWMVLLMFSQLFHVCVARWICDRMASLMCLAIGRLVRHETPRIGPVFLLFSMSGSLLCRQRRLAFISKCFQTPIYTVYADIHWPSLGHSLIEGVCKPHCGGRWTQGWEELRCTFVIHDDIQHWHGARQKEFLIHSSFACLSSSSCFLGLRAQPNSGEVSTTWVSEPVKFSNSLPKEIYIFRCFVSK